MKFAILCISLFLLIGCAPVVVLHRDKQGEAILLRGPQPYYEDFYDLNRDEKVKSILSLRPKDEGFWWPEEKQDIRSFNRIVGYPAMNFYHLDLGDGTKPPTKEQLDYFYSLVEDKAKRPIYMHCQSGIHRAGMMSAIYRIRYQNWSPEKAIEEMESYWYDWSFSNRDSIKNFLRTYDFKRR